MTDRIDGPLDPPCSPRYDRAVDYFCDHADEVLAYHHGALTELFDTIDSDLSSMWPYEDDMPEIEQFEMLKRAVKEWPEPETNRAMREGDTE